jgi:rhamnopyranosyl-N-acetylglucosaminyl-diphospho-decaprenol beta-1,3/1,4-galactofuranosyltransferase
MGLRVAAIVVTYNRPDELRLVISSLISQSRQLDSIVVFDNAGTIPARDVLHDYLDQIEVIRSSENLGGAGGFASGLQFACNQGADWVWLMDDDAIPKQDALAALINLLPGLPEKTGVLCSAVREFGEYAFLHRRYFNRWVGWERPVRAEFYQHTHTEIDTGSFVGFLVASVAVSKVGLPKAEFFLAYDDTEYSLRLQKEGWRLWLVPGSVIEHLRSPGARLSTSDFGAKHYFNIRNRLIVLRQFTKLPYLAMLRGVCFGFALYGLSVSKFNFSGLNVLWFAIRDGFRGRLGIFPLK